MEENPMKILVVEDDLEECNRIIECSKKRKDVEIVAITDSDIDAIKQVKSKNPEGIMLDLELNNSKSGSTDSFELLDNIKKLKYNPIIIVTTHVNSSRTYDILHRKGVELILYKGHPGYSPNQAFNKYWTQGTGYTNANNTSHIGIKTKELNNLIKRYNGYTRADDIFNDMKAGKWTETDERKFRYGR